jgi:signal peptidase I
MALAPAANWTPLVHYREVQRGDIIVLYKPTAQPNGDHIFLVKRVIGIPGDHVHLRAGIVYLNGIAQNEPQAANGVCRAAPVASPRSTFFKEHLIRSGKYSLMPFVAVTEWLP